MNITKLLIGLTLTAVVSTPIVSASEQKMLRTIEDLYGLTFIPTDTEIESIPIKKLDPTWQKVLVLRKEILPKGAQEILEENDSSQNRLTILADLNGDGKPEKALIGVVQTTTGKLDRFLLILEEAGTGRWKKSFIKVDDEGKPGYSEIFWDAKKRKLTWSVCTSCDFVRWIPWNGKMFIDSYPKFELLE